MTNFEKCNAIRRMILTRAAEVFQYTNWDTEFAVGQIREIPQVFAAMEDGKLTGIQPCLLTDGQCDDLGFGRWSDDNPMRLIPLWLLPFLADEIRTSCIDGSATVGRDELDDDHRLGLLAHGVTPSEQEEQADE